MTEDKERKELKEVEINRALKTKDKFRGTERVCMTSSREEDEFISGQRGVRNTGTMTTQQ